MHSVDNSSFWFCIECFVSFQVALLRFFTMNLLFAIRKFVSSPLRHLVSLQTYLHADCCNEFSLLQSNFPAPIHLSHIIVCTQSPYPICSSRHAFPAQLRTFCCLQHCFLPSCPCPVSGLLTRLVFRVFRLRSEFSRTGSFIPWCNHLTLGIAAKASTEKGY